MVRIELNDLRKELVKEELEQHKQEYRNYNRGCLRGDIHYVNLGEAKVQGEQSGIRPCIIIQNDVGNKFSPTVIISVLSSQIHKCKLPTHVLVTREECKGLKYDSFIATEQIKTISKDKLGDYIGHIENERLDKAIRISLGVNEEIQNIIDRRLDTIQFLDKFIYDWIDKGRDISLIVDTIDDRELRIKDLKVYCVEHKKDINDYYKYSEVSIKHNMNKKIEMVG
ncbi:type II toxin-antitoxin system PemK/MazF family toxin [uncultured Clostridium sp.]|uniref:type II toxin-antitoxin system PemK/MazF family toxin n=1 Tax=uncultured Clostridium sp. TaxID=59620 RepID=UPI0032172E82